MSLKELFNNIKVVSADRTLEDLSNNGHSSAETSIAFAESKRKYIPDINFKNPGAFCTFGLAEEYYKNSFKYIYDYFPYDGSRGEEINWFNSSSYLDRYVYENIYPKSVGMLDFSNLSGTLIWNSFTNCSNSPYIPIYGGLNVDKTYNSSSSKDAILKFNLETGITIQYYLNISALTYTGSGSAIISSSCHWGFATPSEYTASYGGLIIDLRDGKTLNLRYLTSSVPWTASINFGETSAYTSSLSTDYNSLTVGLSYNTSSFNFETDFYLNGLLIFSTQSYCANVTSTCYLTGVIGCLPRVSSIYSGAGVTYVAGAAPTWGAYGNYPAVNLIIDDFRVWGRKLQGKEVYKNYSNRVYGNFNDDSTYNKLLIYYKFNEGVVGSDADDSIITDYSGRKSNSSIFNYNSLIRSTSSAINLSGGSEFEDPILNLNNQTLSASLDLYTRIGATYDLNNQHSLLNHIPEWIVDEDYSSNKELIKLTQILSTQLDEIYILGKNIVNVKDMNYLSSGSYNEEIISRILNNYGMNTNGLFNDLSFDEWYLDKNDNVAFSTSIQKIKVGLYKSLYNNLINIYKTKGTENSIRNVFRSLGFDEDLYRIKYYSDNGMYEIDGDKRKAASIRKNYLDLSGNGDLQNLNATVYQSYDGTTGSVSMISGSLGVTTSTVKEFGHGLTLETTVVFGKTKNSLEDGYIDFPDSSLSGSLFGLYTPRTGSLTSAQQLVSTDSTVLTTLPYFNVLFKRSARESKNAKFILNMGLNSVQTAVETSEYPIFDNTKWTLALRFVPLYQSYSVTLPNPYDLTYKVELYGVEENAGSIINEFTISQNIATASFVASPFNMSYSKKPYLGALRTNLTGTVVRPTQAKFSYLRAWFTDLSDDEVKHHSYDPFNFGLLKPYQNLSINDSALSVNYIPRIKSLILNWDFQTITGSDSSGNLTVLDFSSGSAVDVNLSWFNNIFDRRMTGFGYGFNSSNSSMLDKNYVMVSKNRTIDNLLSSDLIRIGSNDDRYFGKTIKPVSYILSVEKNVYDVVNDEILNYFSSISNFNELIGEPINLYRDSYKQLDKFRKIFFNKVINERIDINKYISYYKWLDTTLNYLIYDLIPISMRDSFKLGILIESHLLERNKYVYPITILKHKNRDFTFQLTGHFHPSVSWTPEKVGQKLILVTWSDRVNLPNKVSDF